jgi:hypothetical protein
VDDLRQIGADLGLGDVEILGRNFFGMRSRYPLAKLLARQIDPLLRLAPTLCSDIYLVGTRAGRAASAPPHPAVQPDERSYRAFTR